MGQAERRLRSIPFRTPPADGITLTNNPLESIVRMAYSVQPFRVEGLPAWTREERFDIAARAAGPITDEQRGLMMRSLLVERFRLKARFETREQTIYVMTLARADKQLGPGLKPRRSAARRRRAPLAAAAEQLGLKLEPMRRPVEVLVVQSIDRPTPD